MTYGGNTILNTEESGNHTLKTAGKFLTDDITVTAEGLSELAVSYGGSSRITGTDGTWKMKTAGKFLTGDIGVAAAMSVGPEIDEYCLFGFGGRTCPGDLDRIFAGQRDP